MINRGVIKTIAGYYRYPLFLSAILGVVVFTLRLERSVVNIFLIFLGAFLGTFLLDLDYLIFAYFTEPTHHFSRRIKEFVGQGNLAGLANYVRYHQEAMGRQILHSALFQVLLAITCFYVLSSSTSIIGGMICLAAYAQSFYEQFRDAQRGVLRDWFWILKDEPTESLLWGYFITVGLFFAFCVNLAG